jgi:hypothetical protein
MHLNPDQARRLAATLLAEEEDDAEAGDDFPFVTNADESRALTRRGGTGNPSKLCDSEFVPHSCNPSEPDSLGHHHRTSDAPQ